MVCLFKGVPTESSENRVSEWLQGNLDEDGLSQMRVEYVLVETFCFQSIKLSFVFNPITFHVDCSIFASKLPRQLYTVGPGFP